MLLLCIIVVALLIVVISVCFEHVVLCFCFFFFGGGVGGCVLCFSVFFICVGGDSFRWVLLSRECYCRAPHHTRCISGLETAHCKKAYLQASLLDETCIILPPELWLPHWKGPIAQPAVRIKKALYGHPLACDDWDLHLREILNGRKFLQVLQSMFGEVQPL